MSPHVEWQPQRTKADAIAIGERVYHTGKLCLNGHLALRRAASGNCIECERQAQFESADANEIGETIRRRLLSTPKERDLVDRGAVERADLLDLLRVYQGSQWVQPMGATQ